MSGIFCVAQLTPCLCGLENWSPDSWPSALSRMPCLRLGEVLWGQSHRAQEEIGHLLWMQPCFRCRVRLPQLAEAFEVIWNSSSMVQIGTLRSRYRAALLSSHYQQPRAWPQMCFLCAGGFPPWLPSRMTWVLGESTSAPSFLTPEVLMSLVLGGTPTHCVCF